MDSCERCGSLLPADAQLCLRCGSPVSLGRQRTTAASPGAGAVIDQRYEIVGLLGSGGMGVVYEALDLRLQRRVALKMLHAELVAHPTARNRMEKEARALASIDHPNVIQIRNLFDHGGLLVLELELVTGGTLAERLAERRLDLQPALRIVGSLLGALAAIHEAGVVHRDIKPSNVLMNARGVPKLTDFGVAHEMGGRGITKTGTRLGTPEYMSPEQVKGQVVDHRADIYAMGILIYEMLAGAVPFDGDSEFDVLSAHVNTPPDLSKLSAAPTRVVDAVRRALEKAPDARWATVVEFDQALGFQGNNGAERAASITAPPDQFAIEVESTDDLRGHLLVKSDVIIDTVAKQMWTRRPSPLMSWSAAQRYAATFQLRGKTDRRLPTGSELRSYPGAFEVDTRRLWYAGAGNHSGLIEGYTYCVRSIGEPLAVRLGRLLIGDDAVKELGANLTWLRFGRRVSATDAIAAEREMKAASHTDWRIPTSADLRRLVREIERGGMPVARAAKLIFPGTGRQPNWYRLTPEDEPRKKLLCIPNPTLPLALDNFFLQETVLRQDEGWFLCIRG